MGNIFCFRYDPEHGPESVKDALNVFEKLVQRMEKSDIREEALAE